MPSTVVTMIPIAASVKNHIRIAERFGAGGLTPPAATSGLGVGAGDSAGGAAGRGLGGPGSFWSLWTPANFSIHAGG